MSLFRKTLKAGGDSYTFTEMGASKALYTNKKVKNDKLCFYGNLFYIQLVYI